MSAHEHIFKSEVLKNSFLWKMNKQLFKFIPNFEQTGKVISRYFRINNWRHFENPVKHFWWLTLRKRCPYSELFWSVFSRIRTEYEEILRISPYSFRMRKNKDQNNSEYRHFSRSVTTKNRYPFTRKSSIRDVWQGPRYDSDNDLHLTIDQVSTNSIRNKSDEWNT